jgi:hypothetical protein
MGENWARRLTGGQRAAGRGRNAMGMGSFYRRASRKGNAGLHKEERGR